MKIFLDLLTHRSFIVRAAIEIIVGAVIFFGAWAASLAWLPEGFFLRLPLPSIGNCEPGVSQAWRTFIWNLVLTGGLTAFASLFALNRFPYGYIVPWLMFAFYGGALGTNSFLCEEFSEPLPITLSVLWTRAGFRESMGYLLIAAALANQYLWRQPSFFKARVERVRSWKEFKLNLEVIFGLGTAIFLIAWGAIVEMTPWI
jgi:hypothetical protein